MFGPLGLPEIILIMVLALLIFGPKRLPEMGRTIGKGLAEFRRASTDFKRTINAELALDEGEQVPTARRVSLPGSITVLDPPTPAAAPPAGTAPREEASSSAIDPQDPNSPPPIVVI